LAQEFIARGADLELVGIRKEFPGFTAIENLDLHIPAGEFFALLGPSGCGKTTTLRLVAGLDEPTKGKILIGGKDVTATKPHERRKGVFWSLVDSMGPTGTLCFSHLRPPYTETLRKRGYVHDRQAIAER
jgi:ABC-type bacteriocin/lantibiotic exporter with double-glycine peptidase domain